MNVKYQIFVSSTYEDLKDERNEVIKACLNMGHIPVGMEMFNAADEEQWAVITRTIDQCDYYVVIVAHRYGSTVDGVSFTEKEYEYAVKQGVPVLGFIIDEHAPWPNTKKDEQPDVLEALKRFKAKIKQKMIRLWHTAPELRSQFVESLATTINVNPRRGWVRAPEQTDADVAQTLSNLTEENAQLRRIIDERRESYGLSDQRVDDVAKILQKREVLSSGWPHSAADIFRALAPVLSADGRIDDLYENLSHLSLDRDDLEGLLDELVLYGAASKSGESYLITELGHGVYLRLEAGHH